MILRHPIAGRLCISGHGRRMNVSVKTCFRSCDVSDVYGIPNDSSEHIMNSTYMVPSMIPKSPIIYDRIRRMKRRKSTGPLSCGIIIPVIPVNATIMTTGRLTKFASTEA